jgi:hypothetical protein
LKNINKNCAEPEVFELTKYLFEEIDRELDLDIAKDSLKYIKNIERYSCKDIDSTKKSFKEFIKKSGSDRKEQLTQMKTLLKMNDVLLERQITIRNDSQTV